MLVFTALRFAPTQLKASSMTEPLWRVRWLAVQASSRSVEGWSAWSKPAEISSQVMRYSEVARRRGRTCSASSFQASPYGAPLRERSPDGFYGISSVKQLVMVGAGRRSLSVR